MAIWDAPPPLRQATAEAETDFGRSLSPVGRILEVPDYTVWCCAPIYGPDGRVHVFYSRWLNQFKFDGWLFNCEIAHAVADDVPGPYETVSVALTGRGPGFWDGATIHNPTIHRVGNRYALFYLGTAVRDGKDHDDKYHNTLKTKRIGLAVADSLDGPWTRVTDAAPLIEAGPPGAWDDMGTTNPAYLAHSSGQHWLYYKSWDEAGHRKFWGNRKYGLAISDKLEGPYVKHPDNPLIDFSRFGERVQVEDAYIWYDVDTKTFKAVMRDMAFFSDEYGLLLESLDGLNWSEPRIAYKESAAYFDEPVSTLDRGGRIERPQLLRGPDGRPTHLFGAFRGGKYETSSGVVMKIGR